MKTVVRHKKVSQLTERFFSDSSKSFLESQFAFLSCSASVKRLV